MNKKKTTGLLCLSSITASALLLLPSTLQGSDAAWNGSTSDLWSLSANWEGSPAVPSTGNTATFNSASGNTTINLETGVIINEIVFDTASAAAYTIGSGARDSQQLTLNPSGGITMNASVVSDQYFNSSMLLTTNGLGTGAVTILNNSTAADLYLVGTIMPEPVTAGQTYTLTMDGTGDINANVVKKNGNTGLFALVKEGSGTLTMGDPVAVDTESTDNYALSMIVNEGTVIMTKTNAGRRVVGGYMEAHNDSLIVIAGSNGDQIYGGVDLTFTGTAAIDMNGRNETVDAFNAETGNTVYNTASGTTSAFIVGGGNNSSTFNGTMYDGAGTLAFGKTGNGTHTLTGTNTYSGNTTVYGGTLSVGLMPDAGDSNIGNGSIYFRGGTLKYTGTNNLIITRTVDSNTNTKGGGLDIENADTTISIDSRFAGNGGGLFNKSGEGTLVLTGSADNPSLILSALGGLTKLDKSQAGGTRAVAGVADIAAGATVQLTGYDEDQIYQGSGGYYGNLGLSGGTFDLNERSEQVGFVGGYGVVVNTGANGTTSTLTVGGSNNSGEFAGGIMDGPNGGVVAFTKVGSGTQTITTGMGYTNAYSGATTISGGTLRLDQPPQTPVAGSSLWLDAADTGTVTTNASGTISSWADKSSNSRDATQGTADNQPGYITNEKVNGLNVVDFDGANDLLNVDLSFLAGSDYTMFAVEGRQENAQAYFLGTSVKTDNDINEKLHVGYRDGDSFIQAHYSYDLDYNSAALVYDGNQVFRQWTTSLLSQGTGYGKSIALSGEVVAGPATGNNALPLDSADGGRVGTGFGTGGQFFNGDIAEIIIYSNKLSDADTKLVEAYLAAKWINQSPETGPLPADTAVNITANGATLDLNGVDQQIGSLTGVAGSLVTLGGGTLTVAGTNDTVFAGTIDGIGSLAVAGSGSLTLSAANALSPTSTVTMAGGTLDISAVTSSAASLNVTASSTLVIGAGELSFETQSLDAWTGTLTIGGELGATTLRFQPSLTDSQLDQITFALRPASRAICTEDGYLAMQPNGTLMLVQ